MRGLNKIKIVHVKQTLYGFITCIDEQKALRRDHIENTDREKGFQAFNYIYYNTLTHIGDHRCSSLTGSFSVLGINLLK